MTCKSSSAPDFWDARDATTRKAIISGNETKGCDMGALRRADAPLYEPGGEMLAASAAGGDRGRREFSPFRGTAGRPEPSSARDRDGQKVGHAPAREDWDAKRKPVLGSSAPPP